LSQVCISDIAEKMSITMRVINYRVVYFIFRCWEVNPNIRLLSSNASTILFVVSASVLMRGLPEVSY
ncbi:hypothetical protein L9F63_020511, partial [Diploptera punctata]